MEQEGAKPAPEIAIKQPEVSTINNIFDKENTDEMDGGFNARPERQDFQEKPAVNMVAPSEDLQKPAE